MEIVNRVEQSGIIQINFEEWLDNAPTEIYDLKENLFQGLVLREKDFREFIKNNDWSIYNGKHVGIICSTDAVIQTWAYMLLIVAIQPYAKSVIVGDEQTIITNLLEEKIKSLDPSEYQDARVVIKGCSKKGIAPVTYGALTAKLTPVVKSIMFGEPCSTVPVFKKKA